MPGVSGKAVEATGAPVGEPPGALSLLELAPYLILRFDPDLVTLYVNATAEATLKVARSDVVGKPLRALGIPSDAAALLEREARAALTAAAPRAFDLVLPGAAAPSAPAGLVLRARIAPEAGPAGGPGTLLALLQDVTAEREAARAMARSRLLSEATHHLVGSLDVDATLRAVVGLAVPDLADLAVITLAEASGGPRNALAFADPAKGAILKALERYPSATALGGSHILQAVETGATQVLPTVTDEHYRAIAVDEAHYELLKALGVESGIVVPLRSRGRVLGAVALFAAGGARTFRTDDVAFAEELAGRCALAIENAVLYATEQRSRLDAERALDRLARLQAVSAALSEALTPETVVQVVLEEGVAALGARAGSVAVLREEPEPHVTLLGTIGYPEELVKYFRDVPLHAATPLTDCIRERAPVLLGSGDERAARYPHLARARSLNGDGAMAAVPLQMQGRTLGAMGLNFPDPRAFTHEEREFLFALARQCSQALERARLYDAERTARAQAEESLAFLDTLLQTAPVGFALHDRDLRYVRINDSLAAINGVPSAEHIGKRVEDVLPTMAPRIVPYLERVLATGEPVGNLEIGGETAAQPGLQRHWLTGYYPVRSPTGEVLGVGVVVTEITERKRAEEILRSSETRLRTVIEQSPLSIQLFAPNGRCTFANEAFEKMWNAPASEINGYNILEDPQLDELGLKPIIHRAFAGETIRIPPTPYDPARGGKTGRPRWVETVMYPLKDEADQVREVVLVQTDVTEQKLAEAALLVQKTLLESQSEAALDGILMTDTAGRPVFANRRYGELWNLPGLGRIEAILDRLAAPEAFAAAIARLRGNHDETAGAEIVLHDGRIVDWYSAPVTGPDHTHHGRVWFFRDVTVRRHAEQELEAARRQVADSEKLSALGTLVSGVAHEIRTPLTYIANNVFLARRHLERAAQEGATAEVAFKGAAPALQSVEEGVERINRLVVEMRRFTRPGTAERAPADLPDLVRGAVELFQAAHRNRVRVTLDLRPAGTILVDRVQVQQVVINLLMNAMEAMPGGGTVAVTTGVSGREAEVVVEDQGTGIPAEVRARIFDEFYTTKPQGTGLGLSIVRRIVESHGGRIRCESSPGKGTRFTVSFPNAEAPPQARPDKAT